MLVPIPTSGRPLKLLIIGIILIALIGSYTNTIAGYCIKGPFGGCDENYSEEIKNNMEKKRELDFINLSSIPKQCKPPSTTLRTSLAGVDVVEILRLKR